MKHFPLASVGIECNSVSFSAVCDFIWSKERGLSWSRIAGGAD
jgi:hypothetical protein